MRLPVMISWGGFIWLNGSAKSISGECPGCWAISGDPYSQRMLQHDSSDSGCSLWVAATTLSSISWIDQMVVSAGGLQMTKMQTSEWGEMHPTQDDNCMSFAWEVIHSCTKWEMRCLDLNLSLCTNAQGIRWRARGIDKTANTFISSQQQPK